MTDGSDDEDRAALDDAIGPTFFRYLIPSLAGLIAMTSASLVDGIFIGNYVGVTALAAVNLIIPITALVFGVAMMLSVGGSVRAGKYLGENNVAAASAIFSKTLLNCFKVSSYDKEGSAMVSDQTGSKPITETCGVR